MVPAEFIPFFAAMAGVGATLFGLTFLAVSISAGCAGPARALILRQAQTASSYGALLDRLVISLLALVPWARSSGDKPVSSIDASRPNFV
jgi:hypothetical protein